MRTWPRCELCGSALVPMAQPGIRVWVCARCGGTRLTERVR